MVYPLIGIFLALTGFDYWFTHRRMLKHGVDVEINPVIKLAAKYLGPVKGLFLAGVMPSILFSLAAWAIPNPFLWVLVFLVGYRMAFFNIQLSGLAFEKQLDAIIESLKDKKL